MLCALTVRKLKPGTFDEFRKAFMADMSEGGQPEGWVRFDMLRGTSDPDEVVCFGFYDGTLEEMRSRGYEHYDEQLERIARYVDSTGADQVFDVVEDMALA